nr:cytochrome c biogenesis protein CcdA [Cellulomonas fimi]
MTTGGGLAAGVWEDLGSAFATTAFSGSLLLAVPVALIAGLVSFASPCVLPLVPGYLGYLGGMTGTGVAREGAAGTRGLSAAEDGSALGDRRRAGAGRGRLLLGVALFVSGFAVVFVALGTLAGTLGAELMRWQDPLTRVLGVVVIAMGLSFLGLVPALQRERRVHVRARAGLWGAPMLGFTFGLGWAPCIGPTLAAVIALSLDGGSAGRGAALSTAYALGLGVPFLLIALGLGRSTAALGFLRRHRLVIMRSGGGLLILVGLALVTGLWGTWTQSLQGLIAGFQPVV